MKNFAALLGMLFLSFGRIQGSEPVLIGFDEFPLDSGYITLTNGYSGLDWENVWVRNGARRFPSDGYRVGTITLSNVAINIPLDATSVAGLRSPVPLDVESIYLTAASSDGAVVEVEGWVGGRQAYLNSFTLSSSVPTLAQLDYGGVDRIRFKVQPWSVGIAMDNLLVRWHSSNTNAEPCTFAIIPSHMEHGGGAETGRVDVVAQNGCAWTVVNTNTWIVIVSGLNHTNASSVVYRVASNPRAIPRSGTMTIAGQNFSVSQVAGEPLGTTRPLVNLGVVQVPSIGYEINYPLVGSGEIGRSSNVWEQLIDQDQSSGGGGVLPPVTVNWDTNVQFTLKVAAPPGKRFLVKVPAGKTAFFDGYLVWESGIGNNNATGSWASVRFEGVESAAPEFPETYNFSVLSPSQSIVGFWVIKTPQFTGEFSFSAITFTGIVEPTYTGYESMNYVGQASSSLHLVHSANDPARYISIVPQLPPPSIHVASVSPATGAVLMVQGRALRKHVVESSPDLIHWTAISTNVLPATVCPTCPMAIVQDTLGVASAARFYRVFEVR